jgi:hypothetical protein
LEHTAAVLRRTTTADGPYSTGLGTTIQLIEQMAEKPGVDSVSIRGDPTNQRSLVQTDEPDVRIPCYRFLLKKVVQFGCQRSLITEPRHDAFDPFQQSTVVDGQNMNNVVLRRPMLKRHQKFIKYFVC